MTLPRRKYHVGECRHCRHLGTITRRYRPRTDRACVNATLGKSWWFYGYSAASCPDYEAKEPAPHEPLDAAPAERVE